MSTWKIDPAHTDILFSARHMMVTTVRGKFHEVEGTLELDEDEPTRSSGSFRIRAASLNTGVEQRDDHLRSADFFDAEGHPWITFESTHIQRTRSDAYRVTGDLTIRGTTHPFALDVALEGITPGLRGARPPGRVTGCSAPRRVVRRPMNEGTKLEYVSPTVGASGAPRRGRLAQLGERQLDMLEVGGSKPSPPTIRIGVRKGRQ